VSIPSNIADVSFAVQTAKGAAAAVGTNRLWMAGGSQPHSAEVKEDFEETSGQRMLSDSYISTVSVEGAPEFFVMPESIAPLLYGVLGAQSITGAADPWTHTFVPSASLPYFTFWRMLGNGLTEKMTDCIIASLVLHGESGKPLRVTPTIMGLTPTYLTPAEATAPIEKTNRFMHWDASQAYKVEGSPVACIRSFDLTIDNGAELIPGDALVACDVSVGRLAVTASTTQLVTDFDLWKRLHYASLTPANGAAHTGTVLELAGSPPGLDWLWTRVAASRTLEILVPRVQVEPFDDEPDVAGTPLVRTVEYRAVQPASGAAITAIVKNSKATVY
jgi:hypothetical protein